MKKLIIGLIYILGITGCASDSTVSQSESSAELNPQVNIYDIEDPSAPELVNNITKYRI